MRTLLNTLLRPTSRMLARPLLVRRDEADAFAAQAGLLQAAPVRTVFDVGAHVGKTAAAYRKCFGEATVHCFEPTEATFKELRENTRADARIIAHQMAVSDHPGAVEFHCNQHVSSNSLLKTGRDANRFWGGTLLQTERVTTVEATTLDAFCATGRVDGIDVLKMDIQGAELRALKGGSELIAARKIRLIYMEVIFVPSYEGQAQLHEVLAWLMERGYALHNFYNLTSRKGRLLFCDAIFIPAA